MASLKKNFILNSGYQLLLILLPLITAPYASRVLGLSGIGTYSYTYSIATYFALFVKLGIDNYGNRSIAQVRNSNKKNVVFSEIYLLQLLFGLVTLFFYFVFFLIFQPEYFFIQLIQVIWILSPIIDINWYFFGLEKFQFIIFRNVIVKVSSFILILLLVKQPEDLWIYTLILSLSTFCGYIISWPFLKIKIVFNKATFKGAFKRIRPIIVLFLPVVAISMFTILNKILLANMSNISELGYYDSADKIMLAPKGVIGALGTIMLPRIASIINNGLLREKYLRDALFLVILLSTVFSFGMSSVSTDFAVLFFGKDFSKTGDVIAILSFSLLFYAIGNVIRTQLLLPLENDKPYVISIIIGAIVNLLANLVLIPFLGSIGAAFATLISEITLCCIQVYFVKKELDFSFLMKQIIIFISLGFLMFISVNMVGTLLGFSIISFLVKILIGGIIFITLTILYMLKSKDETINQLSNSIFILKKERKNDKK